MYLIAQVTTYATDASGGFLPYLGFGVCAVGTWQFLGTTTSLERLGALQALSADKSNQVARPRSHESLAYTPKGWSSRLAAPHTHMP